MATAEQSLPLTLDAFAHLSARQKIGAMVAIALALALLVGGWLWAKDPPYGIVFANLSERDGGQIVAALQQQNIPYRISEGGTAILVPVGQVHDVRLRLASQGLPKGGLVGFELMETQKLGISQFAEQINYQRGLEGELARSIQSLAAVKGARVHLAIPKQTAFLRDEQKPTASVLLALHPGRTLEPSQVAGIVHLVSSSVPQLNPAHVSVVDQDGNLISQQSDPQKNAGLDPTQIKYVREMEQSYIKRVEDILAPVVGAGNVRAQVAVDIDFSQIEQVAETYRPNPSPETAIRSQQTVESGLGQPPAVGVPGALSNQPPVPATAPITTPAAPGTPGGTTTTANSQNNYTRNATINYEVDKTVRHTKGMPGTIRRLSVAVVVNHKTDVAKGGKAKPLTEAELKQVNALVQEAVGFSKDRGDTVNISNVAFAPEEKTAIPDTPIWKDPALFALAKEASKWIIYALVALIVWSKVFKPLFAMFAAAAERVKAEEAAQAELAMETAEVHAGHGRRPYEAKLQQARDLAKQDPKVVANVIKEWVGGNESR